jgi:hypothetical protein
MKRTGSGAVSGSVSQRYGSADPDPYQKVTDLEHCFHSFKLLRKIHGTVLNTDPDPQPGTRLVFELFRGSDDSIMRKVYLLRLIPVLLA